MRALLAAAAMLFPIGLHAQQVPNPMAKDGSNAAPQVLFPGSLSVNGGDLASVFYPTLAVKGSPASGGHQHSIAEFTYGGAGAPLPVDPADGYTSIAVQVFGNPGVGTGDPFTAGIASHSHLSAGSRGIALGMLAVGHLEGTWSSAGAFAAGAVGVWAEAESTRGGTTYALEATCRQKTTIGGTQTCIEIDADTQVNVAVRWGLAINSSGTGTVTGSSLIAGSGIGYPLDAAIMVQALNTGAQWSSILTTVQDIAGAQAPVTSNGVLWRAGGFSTSYGLAWADATFAQYAISAGGNIRLNKNSQGGAGTAGTPVELVLHDNSDGGTWDIFNCFSCVTFSSADASVTGAGGRARIGAVMYDGAGSFTDIGFWTSTTANSYIERMRLSAGGSLIFGPGGKLGGAANPALLPSGSILQVKRADEAGFAQIQGKLTTDTSYTAGTKVATGFLTLYDAAGVAYRVNACLASACP